METIQIVILVVNLIILLLIIGLVLGALYLYQLALYYIDIYDQFIANFREMKSNFDLIKSIVEKVST